MYMCTYRSGATDASDQHGHGHGLARHPQEVSECIVSEYILSECIVSEWVSV